MKSPPAFIYNSSMLLCARIQLSVLIGCLALALPCHHGDGWRGAFSPPVALVNDNCLSSSSSLLFQISHRGFLSSMILISFQPPQSYLRRRWRPTFFLRCHFTPSRPPLRRHFLSTIQMGCQHSCIFNKSRGIRLLEAALCVCAAYSCMWVPLTLVCKGETDEKGPKSSIDSTECAILDSLNLLLGW